jgi:hypothetical protein
MFARLSRQLPTVSCFLSLLPHPVSHQTAHKFVAKSNMSTFAAKLAEKKEAFLSDSRAARGHDWTIVMGNDAGGNATILFILCR